MSSREERIGLNEAVFREVNERIENLAETFDLKTQSLDLICECGDGSCTERVTMSRAEYEQLRSDPHNFAVHPGHEHPGDDGLDVRMLVTGMDGEVMWVRAELLVLGSTHRDTLGAGAVAALADEVERLRFEVERLRKILDALVHLAED